jgi:hypothetical protein
MDILVISYRAMRRAVEADVEVLTTPHAKKYSCGISIINLDSG